MVAYYNENNRHAAQVLRDLIKRGLIAPGEVDERSIVDVSPADVADYQQCHFFAGIGGWSYALRLARWPDDRFVWTGSCPCQPFSLAGKQKGFADERHVWPTWFRLIEKRRPAIVFGEQVASASEWFRLVRSDLETLGYAVGAIPLQAALLGAPHRRERLFFVADAASNRLEGNVREAASQEAHDRSPKTLGAWVGTGHPFEDWRKLLDQSSVSRMDDGVSSTLDIRPRLHAYGNAIVPQVAAEFIMALSD